MFLVTQKGDMIPSVKEIVSQEESYMEKDNNLSIMWSIWPLKYVLLRLANGWMVEKVCLKLEDGLDYQNFRGKYEEQIFQAIRSADTSTGMILIYWRNKWINAWKHSDPYRAIPKVTHMGSSDDFQDLAKNHFPQKLIFDFAQPILLHQNLFRTFGTTIQLFSSSFSKKLTMINKYYLLCFIQTTLQGAYHHFHFRDPNNWGSEWWNNCFKVKQPNSVRAGPMHPSRNVPSACELKHVMRQELQVRGRQEQWVGQVAFVLWSVWWVERSFFKRISPCYFFLLKDLISRAREGTLCPSTFRVHPKSLITPTPSPNTV